MNYIHCKLKAYINTIKADNGLGIAATAGLELGAFELQVQHPNRSAA